MVFIFLQGVDYLVEKTWIKVRFGLVAGHNHILLLFLLHANLFFQMQKQTHKKLVTTNTPTPVQNYDNKLTNKPFATHQITNQSF